jgi:poly(A) polymerase
LGKVPKDFDVATNATPEEVKTVFPRCRLIGRRFRLAHVRMRGSLTEVATFRGDHRDGDESDNTSNSDRILRDNVWGTIEEDAMRRDFTINAMFLDPVSGEIRDYVGGYKDLQERKLRLIGDAELRYREDPVRLLRAARFIAKLGVEPVEATAKPIPKMAALLADMPPARLFEEVIKLFLTGHAVRSFETLQRFALSTTLFPAMKPGRQKGRVHLGPMLVQALKNTDDRVAQKKPVTPAFLFAALLWQPLEERAAHHRQNGESPHASVMLAADDIFILQARTTAVPKRFSAVTRQIWISQLRFKKTRGKRWKRLLQERYFRAAYDFLLLRAVEDQELEALCKFWTEAQEGIDFSARRADRSYDDRPPRRRRRPRRQGARGN